jgi:hypothetical protein
MTPRPPAWCRAVACNDHTTSTLRVRRPTVADCRPAATSLVTTATIAPGDAGRSRMCGRHPCRRSAPQSARAPKRGGCAGGRAVLRRCRAPTRAYAGQRRLAEMRIPSLDQGVDRLQSSAVPTARRARWFSAVLLAPVLLGAATASNYFGQRCRLTGVVTLDACCPQASDPAGDGRDFEASAPGHSAVSDPGCCERLLITVARPAGDTRGGQALDCRPRSLTSSLSTPGLTALSLEVSSRLFRHWLQPPGLAPPAFLLRHSFLI